MLKALTPTPPAGTGSTANQRGATAAVAAHGPKLRPVEPADHQSREIHAVAASLQSVTKLRGTVELFAADSLPNDGKVIDDRREHG